MIKKVTLLTTLGAITIGIAIGVSANGIVQKVQSEIRGDFVIKTNGQIQTLKSVDGETVYPMLYEGTTYLPIRAIAELNNKEVVWYEDTKTIDIVDKANSTVTDADKIVNGKQELQETTIAPVQTQNPNQNMQQSVNISLEQAKELAVNKAGVTYNQVQFKKAKLDFEDGRWKYEIEFMQDNVEYEAEIDAQTGVFYKWKIDRD